MKANQAFRENDEAVSPVGGVILMVAITVVLAAVVFVLVNNLGKGTNSAPNLSFQVNDNQDKLEIISAATGANWNRLTVVATSCSFPAAGLINVGGAAVPHQNVAATAAAKTAISAGTSCAGPNVPVAVATTSAAIVAGDFLSFCATTSAAINVNIQIVDTGANSQIGSYSFPTVALCV